MTVTGILNDRRRLQMYLDICAEEQRQLRSSKPTDAKLRRVAKNAVPVRLRGAARVAATNVVAPRERRRARTIADTSPLLLHLGSGGEHKDSWINVDLAGDPVELAWNMARPLPFRAGTVDGIFHEHLLEHLPLEVGALFLRECHRVLRPGGVLRVGVPDAGALLNAYVKHDDDYLNAIHPDRPTRMLAVQELFYWHRHCTMYDEETLQFVMRAADFPSPQRREFGDSSFNPAPDTLRRKAETLYVEAVKPD